MPRKTANSRTENPFQKHFDQAKKSPTYWSEITMIRTCEELLKAVREGNVSETELAKKLGKTPKQTYNLLRGIKQPTIDELTKLAFHLGKRVEIRLADIEQKA